MSARKVADHLRRTLAEASAEGATGGGGPPLGTSAGDAPPPCATADGGPPPGATAGAAPSPDVTADSGPPLGTTADCVPSPGDHLRQVMEEQFQHLRDRFRDDTFPCPDKLLKEWNSAARAVQDAAGGEADTLPVQIASTWLQTSLELSPPVLDGVFNRSEKAALIGPSKARKSFTALYLALCVANGREFLGFRAHRGKVLLVNLELSAAEQQYRVRRVSNGMKETDPALDLENLHVINARAFTHRIMTLEIIHGVVTAVFTRWFYNLVAEGNYSLVIFDPLYILLAGDENSGRDVKPTLNAFTALAEETNTAVLYVHHTAKGYSGDRQTVDRGAGSGLIARDYNASLTITPHKIDGLVVLECTARSYAPTPPCTIQFDPARMLFVKNDTAPEVRRSGGRPQGRPQLLSAITDAAVVAHVGQAQSIPAGELIRWIMATGQVGDKRARESMRGLEESGKLVRRMEKRAGGSHLMELPNTTE